MEAGSKVRVKADPGRAGYLTGRYRDIAGRRYWQVDFLGDQSFLAEDQLELAEQPEDPLERMRKGRLGRVSELRRILTHVRLSGRLANLIYSMETTNTDFYAYQFKPVLKILNTPTKGILIADEVGLGKTIEAGLIWTELRSRFDDRHLMILCPAVLRTKWRTELRRRFGIDAEAMGAADTFQRLREIATEDRRKDFAIICSFQGLRPRRGWSDTSNTANDDSATQLARFLESQSEDDPLIDLLIIDEAHYLRNPESMTAELGRLLGSISNRLVLLSATPIHLRSADLYQQLNLIDPDTFNQPTIFDSLIEANAPVVQSREMVISGSVTAHDIMPLLEEARRSPFLRSNRQLASIIDDLRGSPPTSLSSEERSRFAYRLDGVNLLGNVVSRTRKRDVQEWRVVREAIPEKVSMTAAERDFYDKVTEVLRDFCLRYAQHEGFLLVTPQRQVSSRMPAALRAWRERSKLYRIADETFEDLGVEEAEGPGPVVQEILRHVESFGDYEVSSAGLKVQLLRGHGSSILCGAPGREARRFLLLQAYPALSLGTVVGGADFQCGSVGRCRSRQGRDTRAFRCGGWASGSTFIGSRQRRCRSAILPSRC